MSISASMVKELRERTGAGMMECKKALVETDGDIEAAIEQLRMSGQAKADKKASRVAADGRILIVQEGNKAVIVEVNSETDFVAKDENFSAFAEQAAQAIFSSPAENVEQFMSETLANGKTVEQARTELIAKVGEKISLRRFTRISADDRIGSYTHGARIGAVVAMTGGDDELARDIAMHIAASNPVCVDASDVPADTLERERHIFEEQAQTSGKPAEIIEKMVQGRINKFLKEVTLVGQPFVKDPDITVGKLLSNSNATVSSFTRFEVGEGIEKKKENFAEEVMAQIKQSES